MSEHPNVGLMRELLDAFNSRDEEKIRSLMADDVTWHMIGGQTTTGLEELAALMGGEEARPFEVTAEVHDVVGNDKHVMAMVNATATAGDQTFEYRTVEIVHMDDGKVTERWAFSDDTQAINDFFSQMG